MNIPALFETLQPAIPALLPDARYWELIERDARDDLDAVETAELESLIAEKEARAGEMGL